MAGLRLKHIYKVYPNGVKAVNDFTMDIEDKEFIVFVGPSGCGKSTTLRMIAGLEEITAGELVIEDKVVNKLEPKDRDIAMVFQNYALYPHMTVYDNMAFGLKLRKVPKAEIDKKVKEAAEILGITEYLKRKPKEMSGGQRQRVALGRAIVREPKVFLLDEPLSNLDAKLRTTMRSEISKLHHKLQTTFIYVTHDQIEAMTMGTRIVVMKDGFVQQIDSPRNLYRFPENKFVAGFIGTPQMNFYKGTAFAFEDKVTLVFSDADVKIESPISNFYKADKKYFNGNKPLVFGIRPEYISVDENQFGATAKCRVTTVEELGTECLVYADFNIESEVSLSDSITKVILKAPAGTEYNVGDIINVSIDVQHICMFDEETEQSILPRIPEKVAVDGQVIDGELSIFGTKIILPPAIKLESGNYKVNIPTSAIKSGSLVKVNTLNTEMVNKDKLFTLESNGNVLFMIDNNAEEVNAIDIDIKALSFENETNAFESLKQTNSITIKVSKEKEEGTKEVKGKVKNCKVNKYYFNVGENKFECPENIYDQLISCAGKNIIGQELSMNFDPYSVSISDSGINASIKEVLDYGVEKFVKCDVNGQEVIAFMNEETNSDSIKLNIDVNKVSIVENKLNVRLI